MAWISGFMTQRPRCQVHNLKTWSGYTHRNSMVIPKIWSASAGLGRHWNRIFCENMNTLSQRCTGFKFSYSFTWGRFFVHFFQGKFRGKFRGKFSPKNIGKKWNFPRKKFWKIVFQEMPRNFPRKKCTKNRPLVKIKFRGIVKLR
jgi:hypothetical protein